MIENVSDLKYFQEVAKTLNLTRASERLGITQPSLTLAIQRLELQLGTQLLERSRKGVLLTRAGEMLQKKSDYLLQEWEREMRLVSQLSHEPTGRYTLGVHVSVAQYTLDRFIPQLLEKYKNLEFEFKHDLSRKITEQVISRQCDLGLVINPVAHPDLIMHKILSDEVTLFKNKNYKGDALIFDPELKQSQSLLNKIKKIFPYQREIHSSSLEVIRNLVESGAGVGILPSRVAQKLQRIKEAPIFRDELYLIYRMERKNEDALKVIVEFLKTSFK